VWLSARSAPRLRARSIDLFRGWALGSYAGGHIAWPYILHTVCTNYLHGPQEIGSCQIDHALLQQGRSPSLTAGGSLNRRSRLSPVRYMSVISGPPERATVVSGGECRWIERVVDQCLAEPLWSSADVIEHNTEPQESAPRRRDAGARTLALLERAVRRPLSSTLQRGRDKIANRGADLRILRSVISGRCWVRTNVG
jgi:hypothetical protein